jgi:hypothetical protein
MRYGKTLPRNYGGANSPSNLDGSDVDDEARRGAEIEELRNFKTPDLDAKFEDQEEGTEMGLEEKEEVINIFNTFLSFQEFHKTFIHQKSYFLFF